MYTVKFIKAPASEARPKPRFSAIACFLLEKIKIMCLFVSRLHYNVQVEVRAKFEGVSSPLCPVPGIESRSPGLVVKAFTC